MRDSVHHSQIGTRPLTDREEQVLRVVVREYIEAAAPVPSRKVAERFSLRLSSASMRSVMAGLEHLGLLCHPHTSAGRIPTALGFRYYLDHILDIQGLAEHTALVVNEAFLEVGGSLSDAMRATSRALSRLTHQAALAVGPRFDDLVVERIDLIRLAGPSLLVLVVSQQGLLHQRRVTFDERVEQGDLDRVGAQLNERLRGYSIGAIRRRVLAEIGRDKRVLDRWMSRALAACGAALASGDSELYLEGSVNVLEAQEIRKDVGRMRSLLRAIEDHSLLLKILDRAARAEGVQVHLGGEGELEALEGISLVTSAMEGPQGPEGVVGVLGPVRMDYDTVVPLVGYASKLISRRLWETP